MVVNGTQEFIGSSKSKGEKIINNALAQKKTQHILYVDSEVDEQKVNVKYQLSGELDQYVINFALVEKEIVTKVSRGENSRKTLTHDNVVRDFVISKGMKQGLVTLSIPEDAKYSNLSVIAYVQNHNSMTITTAAESKF